MQFVQIDYKRQIRKCVYTIIAITLNLLLDPFIIGFFKDIINLFNYNSPVPYNSVPAIGLLVMVPLVTVFTGLSIWIWREGKQQHKHKHQPQQQIKKESSLDVYSQDNNNNNNLSKQLSNFFLKAQHLDLVGTLQQLTTSIIIIIIIPVLSEKNDKIKVLVCDNNENNNNNNIWIPCQIDKVIISSQAASNNNNNKISSRISTLKNLRIKDPLVPSPDQAYL